MNNFEISPHPEMDEEIRNPEGLSLVELPLAQEEIEENEGLILIKPAGFEEESAPIVGARTAEPGDVAWNREIFFGEAGINPQRVVRIQQKHTANVREITSVMAGAGALDQTGEDTRIKSEEGQGIDAAWTKDTDLTLMVGTADCSSILLAGKDKDGEAIVGIAHSGIAGSQGDVTGNLIQSMIENGDLDPSSISAYVGPSVCERCFDAISDDPSDISAEKMPMEEKIMINEDGVETSIPITKMTASFLRFKEKYAQAYEKISGRELQENDLYYIDRTADGQHNELRVNINMFVYLSLIGNGVAPEKIGFSSICSAHDHLPSYKRNKETTGTFSTIKIK